MGNTTRQGMKFGLILLLLLAGVVLGIRMLLSREGGRPRYTDMPQLLALCDSKNAPAVKEALLHSDEGALRNEETTLLHVLLERDADPAVLREALSPPSPLLRMVQLTDAQGRTPLHIAAARANPAALLLLHCIRITFREHHLCTSGGEGVPFLRLSCHERGRARLCRRRSGRRGLPARR